MKNFDNNKKIKLIALDLDGTLVTETTGISQKDKDAIKKAREMGIYVCLSSGRATNALKPFYDELDLDTMMISNGGAVVSDKEGNILYTKYVEPKTAARVVNYAMDKGCYIQTYVDGDYFFYEYTDHTKLYETRTGVAGFLDKTLPEKDEIFSAKILVIDSPQRIEALLPELREQFPDVEVNRSFMEYIEINDPGCSKAHALEAMGKMLNIDAGEMMAIGDSGIDLSMIKYAGTGIAMQNAGEDIRAEADDVTGDVLESGVAQAIEKYCF